MGSRPPGPFVPPPFDPSDYWTVLVYVRNDGMRLEHAAARLRSEKPIVMDAVKQNGMALRFAAAPLRSDRDVVKAAVNENGLALRYASEEFRADRTCVLRAVRQNGDAIQHASDELKADPKVVLRAMETSEIAFRHAAASLKGNREFVLGVVRDYPDELEHASEELKADAEVVLAALGGRGDNPSAIRFAPIALRGNKGFMLRAIRANPGAVQYAAVDLFADVDVVSEAMDGNPNFGIGALVKNPALRNNIDIARIAFRRAKEINPAVVAQVKREYIKMGVSEDFIEHAMNEDDKPSKKPRKGGRLTRKRLYLESSI